MTTTAEALALPTWCTKKVMRGYCWQDVLFADDDYVLVSSLLSGARHSLIKRGRELQSPRCARTPYSIDLAVSATKAAPLEHFAPLLARPAQQGWEIEVPTDSACFISLLGGRRVPADWHSALLSYVEGDATGLGIYFTEAEYRRGVFYGTDCETFIDLQLPLTGADLIDALNAAFARRLVTSCTLAIAIETKRADGHWYQQEFNLFYNRLDACFRALATDTRTSGEWCDIGNLSLHPGLDIYWFNGAWRSRRAAREIIFRELGGSDESHWRVAIGETLRWTPGMPNCRIGWNWRNPSAQYGPRIPFAELRRDAHFTWHSVHPLLLGVALAFAPMQLPPYVLLEIIDWLVPFTSTAHVPKIMLLRGVRKSYDAVRTARETRACSSTSATTANLGASKTKRPRTDENGECVAIKTQRLI